ncbi:hypothetical protein CDD83_3672 [Cordyceps sp. RAO-2017]|nr:hypothetical protein CDD83_3672 [Cordyceps sp. RAO-2017]
MAGLAAPRSQPDGAEPRPPPLHVHQEEEFDEKHTAPSLDTFNTLATPPDTDALSPSGQRIEARRLNDDLELLRAERLVSNQEQEQQLGSKSKNRSHHPEPEDAFNQPSTKDPTVKLKNKDAALYKFWLLLKKFPRSVRYLLYLFPGAALLLVPVLLGGIEFRPDDKLVGGVGGVQLMWFGIWLEVVWCSLWLSRLLTSLLPSLFYTVAHVGGSINARKWKEIGSRLELPTALFLWFLAILVSFKPTTDGHRGRVPPGRDADVGVAWIDVVNKVIIALFTLATLNLVEKLVIQWIATSFHQRTYSTRIENNKADTLHLVRLYEYAKAKLEHSDSFWQRATGTTNTGAHTPLKSLHNNARHVLGKVGQVANRVGNDLIGRKVNTNVPRKVVSELLRTTTASHSLARLIYRSLVRDGRDTVYPDDLAVVFDEQDDIDATFSVFDKDLNGDISIDEFEAVCNEIHLEKKAIAASLKDLDSVIRKLDNVFLFIIVVIAIIVFISILPSSSSSSSTPSTSATASPSTAPPAPT